MPLLRNAKKALRQSKKKAVINQRAKSRMKTAMDKAKTSLTKDNVSNVFSAIDKAVKKHLLHRNKASRLKSQLGKKLNSVKA